MPKVLVDQNSVLLEKATSHRRCHNVNYGIIELGSPVVLQKEIQSSYKWAICFSLPLSSHKAWLECIHLREKEKEIDPNFGSKSV